jgi:serine/threonine protein kinase
VTSSGDAPVTFGPFLADRPVARGGMGEVWRAAHPPTGLPVAVKVLRGERAARGHAQLVRETRLVARLGRASTSAQRGWSALR